MGGSWGTEQVQRTLATPSSGSLSSAASGIVPQQHALACDPDEREFVEDLDFVLPNEFETELRTLVWVLLSSGSSLVEISETDAMMN